ncbi:hypothetical protein PsorP6_005834 [Peronosclerospora sorghi]|uniref:Uncharacterized protein n=1 Tax=Peronosclerospora sorghi TaxID=230839 RepID=A0ACC0W363_9STRA|nr:hypothetical protein PsorP6_005834 [Peronosclerospora sorghi]
MQAIRKTVLRSAPRSSVLFCTYNCYRLRGHRFFHQRSCSTIRNVATERVFPNFSVYSSGSAFQVTPNAPQYTRGGNYLKNKRVGAILLSWAKASNTGYNYQNKTYFSLSPSEVGLVLELLDMRIPELSLKHSPHINASEEEKNTKSLHITRVVGSDGNPLVQIKVSYEEECVTTLSVGEARVFRVRVFQMFLIFFYHYEIIFYFLLRFTGTAGLLTSPLVRFSFGTLKMELEAGSRRKMGARILLNLVLDIAVRTTKVQATGPSSAA